MKPPQDWLDAIAGIERDLDAGTLRGGLAVRARTVVRWARLVAKAVESGDPKRIDQLLADRSPGTFPVWLRDLGTLRSLLTSGALVEDTGTVTIRWDLVPIEHREAAVSAANEIVDQYRGRSVGGRPPRR